MIAVKIRSVLMGNLLKTTKWTGLVDWVEKTEGWSVRHKILLSFGLSCWTSCSCWQSARCGRYPTYECV